MKLLACLLAASTWCGIAHADPESAPSHYRFTDDPISLNLVAGLGTPTGELGGTVEYSFTDWFAAGVGAGYGLTGTQYGLSGRFRLARAEGAHVAQAFDFAFALSTGHYTNPVFGCDDNGCWDMQAYWAQAGFDYELQVSHFRLATGVGGAVMVGRSGVEETTVDAAPGPLPDPIAVLTGHVTVGFAFGL